MIKKIKIKQEYLLTTDSGQFLITFSKVTKKYIKYSGYDFKWEISFDEIRETILGSDKKTLVYWMENMVPMSKLVEVLYR